MASQCPLPAAWTPFRPHATQLALNTTRARFVSVPAGRGSGKTELALRRLVMCLPVRKPWDDPRYFFAAPTISHAKEIAWHRLLSLIPPDWLAGTLRSADAMEIRSVFGSTIQLLSLSSQDRSRIEGRQWDGGVIDESCDIPPGVFDRQIVPALTWRSGWCWRIGVPKRQGVGALEFRQWHEDNLASDDPTRAGFWWPSRDILPPETLEYAKRHLDAADYQEQFEASFLSATGGVFFSFSEANVRPVTYDQTKPLVIGCDFNRDPMCWVVCHRYPDRLEVVDELWLRDVTTGGALDVLANRYASHTGGFEWYCDAAGGQRRTSAETMGKEIVTDLVQILNDARFGNSRLVFPAVKAAGKREGNPPVKSRIAACNSMLKNAAGESRLHIAPHCKRLIEDLKVRHYKPGTWEPQDSPMVGHMTDALGYVVWPLYSIEKQPTKSVPRPIHLVGAA